MDFAVLGSGLNDLEPWINNAGGGSRSEGGALSGRWEPPIHEALTKLAVTRCWPWQGGEIDGIWVISEWFRGR